MEYAMVSLTVNGRIVEAEENQKLIYFLRDTLRLTSVKNGCMEGACGTCTVLIDGKPMKACVQITNRLVGKSIMTIEGFPEREYAVYQYAFAHCGAVQCGFCIPGLIMSTMEIVNTGKTYSRDEIRKMLSGHLCRCTGYQDVINAVEKAVNLVNGMVGEEAVTPEA